jgi:hypothetical protein
MKSLLIFLGVFVLSKAGTPAPLPFFPSSNGTATDPVSFFAGNVAPSSVAFQSHLHFVSAGTADDVNNVFAALPQISNQAVVVGHHWCHPDLIGGYSRPTTRVSRYPERPSSASLYYLRHQRYVIILLPCASA